MLKMLPVIGSALLAALALSMVLAASALAEEALKWLVDGATVATKEASQITGTLRLTDTGTLVGTASVVCSTSLDGTIGPETEGTITEALNAAKEKVSSTPLTGVALTCTSASGCSASPAPKVWIDGLPFKSKVELAFERQVDQIVKTGGGTLGFEVECTVLGVKVTDECVGEFFGEPVLENMTEGLLATFNGGKGICSMSKEATGHIEGETFITLNSGLTLTVSGS